MNVTIKTIAKELNLSFSTIARALKDDRRISVEVREKVNKTAKEMGYVPNMIAKGLVSNKTHSIGFIMNDLSWSFFSELSCYVQEAAGYHDYSTFLFSSANNVKKERIGIEQFRARRTDGMLIFANENIENIRYLEKIAKTGPPIVLLNNLDNVNLDIVAVDNVNASEQAMSYLIQLGHRRIAYIGPISCNTVEKERFQGYKNVLRNSGIEIDQSLIYTDKADLLLGYYATKKLMEITNSPTAILVYNDTMAVSVLKAAYEMNIKVPEKLSIISIDGLEIGEIIYPSLTTVKVPIKQLADFSIKLLKERIELNNDEQITTCQKILLKPELIVRGSTSVYKK